MQESRNERQQICTANYAKLAKFYRVEHAQRETNSSRAGFSNPASPTGKSAKQSDRMRPCRASLRTHRATNAPIARRGRAPTR